jgi:hypothetical protein
MSSQFPATSPANVPTAATILKTTVAALVVAVILLFTMILPAEYGVDPMGTGRMLGLTAISSPPLDHSLPTAPAGVPLVPTVLGPVGQYPAEFRVDTREIVVDPYQFVEYKYRLEKGATMLYAWSANVTPAFDFHGDPDGTPAPDPVSFQKDAQRQANGSFVAPFSGIHGWFWENPGGDTLRISLTTAGFYTAATEFRSPRRRESRELLPLDRLTMLRTPQPAAGTSAQP